MTTSKEDKKQKEYQAVLEQLLKEQPNKKCADCGAAGKGKEGHRLNTREWMVNE